MEYLRRLSEDHIALLGCFSAVSVALLLLAAFGRGRSGRAVPRAGRGPRRVNGPRAEKPSQIASEQRAA